MKIQIIKYFLFVFLISNLCCEKDTEETIINQENDKDIKNVNIKPPISKPLSEKTLKKILHILPEKIKKNLDDDTSMSSNFLKNTTEDDIQKIETKLKIQKKLEDLLKNNSKK